MGAFASIARGHVRPLGALSALATLEAALALAQPWPLKLAIDNAVEMQAFPSWLARLDPLSMAARSAVAIAASLLIVATAGGVAFAMTLVAARTSESIALNLRCTAMGRLLDPNALIDRDLPAGEVVNRLTVDVARVEDTITSVAAVVVPEVLTLVGIVIVMARVDFTFAATSLVVVPLFWATTVKRRRAARQAEQASRAASGRLATRTVLLAQQASVIRLFGQRATATRRYRHENQRARQARLVAAGVDARFRPIGDLLVTAVGGVCLAVGISRVSSGEMTVGTLLVVLAYMNRIFGPVRALSGLATSLAKASASRDRLADLLGEDHLPSMGRRLAAPSGPPTVRFESVASSYNGVDEALRDVSITLPSGSLTVVVGESGAGKSTLCGLLTGTAPLTSGRILFNGVVLGECDRDSVLDQMAVVPQDSSLLDGSVVSNIGFGRSGATFHEVLAAARACRVDTFVSALADGYDTSLGEGGSGLSGGEKRRVALARAALRNAPLLILDEPLSGLDASTAQDLMSDMRALTCGRTSLAVSHHLSLALQADQVVVLCNGGVVELGSPSELLQAGGPFTKLWASAHEHLQQGESNHEQALGMLGSVRRPRRVGSVRQVAEVPQVTQVAQVPQVRLQLSCDSPGRPSTAVASPARSSGTP